MRKVLPLLIFVFSIWVGSSKAQVNFSVPTIETCNATVSVPIIVTGFTNITAFSYSMYWDENILSFNSVGSFNLQHLNGPDFGLTQTGSGFYTLAWVDDDGSGETLADGTTIYTVEFTVLGGMGDFSDIEFSNMPTQIIVGSGFPPASVPVTTTNGLVTVDDTVDPTISCPGNVVINTANPSQVVNGIAPTMFNDNCGVPTITYSSTGATVLSGNNDISGQSFNAMPNSGVTTVTYTATDGKGNTADCSFTVTINQIVADLLVTAVSDTAFCQDSVLAIKIEVDNFASVTALSFSLLWDETKIRFDSVENFNLQHLDNGDFGFGQTPNGVLTFAWIDDDGSGETVPNGDSIFVIYFTTLVQTTDQSDLTFSNTPTSIVAGQGFPPSSIPIITNNGIGAKVDDPPVFDNCPSNATLFNDAMACGAIHTWPTVTAMDDCDGVIPVMQTGGSASGALFPVGVTTVTYEATDSKSQTTTCTFTVTVTDNEAPVPDVATLPNVTGECSATAVAPTATDNCAGTVTGTTTDPLTYTTQGSFTITWTYDDGNGNTSMQTQTVIVDDVTAPVPDVAMLPDVTGECSATVTGTPTATDNCSGTINGTTTDPLTYTTQGTFTVTWTFDDGNGNTSTQTQTVIVDDVTAPVPDVALLPDVTGECSATVTGTPTATDNCSGTITGTTTDPLTYTIQGTFTITWTYDDGNGNTSTQTQTVIVDDVTAPVPDVAMLPDATGECSVTAVAPTATDNCTGAITGTTTDPLTYTTQGTFTITWTFDDGNGNTSTQTQTIIVDDVTAPVPDVAMLPDATGECSVTAVAPTATDNCTGAITGTTTDPLTYTTQGTFTITWTYDDGNGNTSTQTQTVIVDDVTAPVPDVATLPDVTGECSATVTGTPTATDNCSGMITGTTTDPLTYTTQGTFTVTWTYDDGNGNTSTQTQTVIVDDVTAPVPDVAMLPDVTGECSATVTGTPTATDNCSGTVTGTTTDPLTYTTQGTFTITWTFDDGNGNTSTQTQTVIVDDVTAPVPDVAMLPDVTGECSATVTGTPTATDNCSGTITGTTTDPLTYTTQGTFTITWTYDDGNGNTSTQTQTVIVNDVTAPVPDVAMLPDVTGECSATAVAPNATDNCSGTVTGTTTDPLTYTTQGTFTITWTYDDGNGSTSTQTQTVIVDDVTAPVPDVAMLPDVTGECSATAVAPTATDNCSGTVTGTTTDPLTYTTQGTFTITWTYDDGNGNTSTQMQTVIVDDVTAPVPDVAMLPDVTGECSATAVAPTATDNCSGAITGTTTDPLTYTTQGTFTITWTYDDGNGNTSTQMQTVIVDDVTAPTIICPPNDTVAINANCEGTLIDYTSLATVNDNCTLPANIVVAQSPLPGLINTETDVTLTATDEAGNVSLPCTFKVFLDDQISPNAICFSDTTVYLDDMGQVAIDVTFVNNGSNDNCSGITLSIDQTMFNCSDIGDNTVTLTVLDANGNDSTCTTNVIVSDSIPPQLVQCANDTFLIADANCEAILPDFTASVIFDDNCTAYGDLKITQVPPNGSILTSDTTVAVVALDSVGLISDTCFFLVELRDTTPPTIICPSDTMIVASLDSCNAIYTWPMPIASDNCGVDTVICSPASGSLFSVGSTKVNCTAVASGDTTACDFIVIVKDEQIPYIDCPSDTTIFASTGIVDTMIFNIGLDSLSDNCMVDTFYHILTGAMMGGGNGDASGTAFVPGTTTVTYYVEDSSGNIDSCSFDVTILQSIIIDLACPSDYTVSTDAGLCSAVVNTDAPGIDPIAGLDTIFYVLTNATTGSGPDSVPDDQVFNKGVTTVTYTAVSITNDTSTCSFSVTVLDQEAPMITCPSSVVTVDNTTDSCGVIFDANLQTATATDNCPGVVVTYSVPTGNLLPIGTNTIIATATDQALTPNAATCTYQVMVRDTQPPLISQCPANIIVNNDFGQCGAAVTWTPPTATDNCGVLLLESTPYEPGDFIPVGTEFITYTAADFTGNITECIFSVTVRDNEPPSLNPCPGDISVTTQPGLCSAVVSWPFIQPTDNCNVVSFVVVPQSGTVFQVGQTTVQAVATDASGNVTVCSFSVTVTDSEFPTISGFPGNMTVSSDPGECGAVVTWGAITVNDNCGIDTFYCDAASGDFFPIGMTTVECTVIDVNGNAVNQDFVITVEDDELPTVDCPDNILIYVDSSVVVDPSGFINSFQAVACDSLTLNYNAINAMDNCGVAAISQTGGPVSGSTIAAGMQTITYLITDVNGNQSVCGFNITIEAVPDPVAVAAPSNPCEGGAVVFSTDTYPGATYEWKDPSGMVISSSASFTLTGVSLAMSGKYMVTISFPFDCVLTSEVDITVFPSPVLGISHNDLLCAAAGTPLMLEAIDTANTGNLNYVWSTPGGAIFFGNPVTVNNPQQGTYAVTATTANGCTATTSVFITISAVPKTPDLNGNKTEACVGESIVLDGEEFAGPGITYHWSASPDLATAGINDINNHDNQANPTVPGTYIYYFYVTQGGCVSDSAEWQVVVEDYPDFTLSVTGETDCVDGTSDITIEGVTSMAGLLWAVDVNGNCTASQMDSLFTLAGVTEDCSGLYEVTATSAIGCATTQSVNLDITNKPVTPVLQVTDNVICMGGSTTLFLTNTPFGANILCYENNVQVSCATMLGSPIQPMATTEYGVQYDVFGCLSDTIFTTVTVEAPLDVDINRTGDITCVDGTGTVTLSTIAGGNIYEWDGPCGVQVGDVLEIPNITPACSGLYSVSITGALGQCISIGTLQLEVTGMLGAVTAELLNEPCDGGDLSFCAEPAMPGAIYTWTDPFGNVFSNERCPVTAAISASTPYSVTVNVDGCTSSDDTLVTVITAPIANDETVVGIVNTAQSFNVVVNDVLATDNYTIVVKQNPLHGNVSYNGEGVFTYTPQRDFRETDVMAYEICYDECPDLCDIAFVTILVRYPVDQCIATTVITPNSDGINDPFVVSCLELGGCPNNQLFIFNQWGDQVFEAAPYDNTWEGTYNGKDVPDGTYFYIFQCDESSPAEKGFVVIHR